MNRMSEFQKAAESAQLELKASTAASASAQATFQKSAKLEAGEATAIVIPITPEDEEMEMPRFFAQVDQIKEENKRASLFTDEIEKLHKAALASADSAVQEDCSNKIEALMAKVNQITNRTRRILQEMDGVNRQLVASGASSSANLRMRESNHRQLSKAFMDVMRKYQKMQETYQDKYRAQMQRQYLIVKPTATKAELAELTKDPEAMKVQIFALSVKEDSKKTLGQMKNRLQDMQNIEKSILELNQLFLEMQDLVLSQGEVINRIEYNVDHIEDYTAKAAKNLTVAVESQKAIQKKKWYITLIVLAIIGIVIFIVLFGVFKEIIVLSLFSAFMKW